MSKRANILSKFINIIGFNWILLDCHLIDIGMAPGQGSPWLIKCPGFSWVLDMFLILSILGTRAGMHACCVTYISHHAAMVARVSYDSVWRERHAVIFVFFIVKNSLEFFPKIALKNLEKP